MSQGPILPAGARAPVTVRGTQVALRDVGGLDLHEPFFDQSLQRAAHLPLSWVPWTEVPTAAPAAVIAHVGRCGSTLAARLLDGIGLTTLREPALLAESRAPDHDRLGWYGALDPGSVVIKLSSTASPRLSQTLGRHRPPIIAIVRNPASTIASALRSPPRHATLLYDAPHAVRAVWPLRAEPDDDRPPTYPRLLLRGWCSAVEGLLAWNASPIVFTDHRNLVQDPAAEVRRWVRLLGYPTLEVDLQAIASVDAKRGGVWTDRAEAAFADPFAAEVRAKTAPLAHRLALRCVDGR